MLNRYAIVILGMHRSGTSALTRMLGLLGCTLPATLVPANRTNPAGHWESRPICDFDDEVFAAAGTHWLDWLPLNPDFPRSAVWPGLVKRARALLRSEFDTASLFVVKDPRMCRLADLWLDAIDAEKVEPLVVLMLRHPLEVSSSLVGSGYPVDDGYGKLLWLRHLLSAEAATRGRRRAVVTFDGLMTNWEAVTERLTADLGVHWPCRTALVANEVDTFLSSSLRHHNISDHDPDGSRLRSWVSATYAILSRWAECGENPDDYQTLDALLEAFDAAAPVFAPSLIISAEAQKTAAGLRDELATVLQAREEALIERDAALVANQRVSSELDAARHLIAGQVDAERARIEGENEARQDVLDLRHALAFAQSQCIQREEQLAQVEAQAAAERTELEHLQGAISESRGEIDRLTRRLIEADEWVFRLAADREAAAAAVRRIEASSAHETQRAARELAKVRGDLQRALSVADGRAAAAESAHQAALAEMRAQEEAQAGERATEIATLTGLFHAGEKVAATRIATVEQEVAERYREITILTGLLRAREDDAAALTGAAEQARSSVAAAEQDRDAALAGHRLLVQELAEARAQRDIQAHDQRNEIAALGRLLQARQDDVAMKEEAAIGSGRIADALASFPGWWVLVPRSLRERWEEQRLCRQGIFDADAYRAANPDVAAAGVSPIRHYLRFGLQERRTGIR